MAWALADTSNPHLLRGRRRRSGEEGVEEGVRRCLSVEGDKELEE